MGMTHPCGLQWGRGLPSAETSLKSGDVGAVVERSIRGCVDNYVMEHSLQWGRGLPSAETKWNTPSRSHCAVLQWDRGLPSAETISP